MQNPYQPPAEPPPSGALGGLDAVYGCPQCKSTAIKKPGFTWWGGALGPKMLNHRICQSCGFGFNEKTRQSNTTAIAIYMIVVFVLSGILFYYLRF